MHDIDRKLQGFESYLNFAQKIPSSVQLFNVFPFLK